MSDKCFSYMYIICCFGCVIMLNTALLIFSYLSNINDLIWTICMGVYYFIVGIIYLGLFGLIVKNSFDHLEKIIKLNVANDSEDYTPENISNDTQLIFKHILLNLVFLVTSIILNSFFDYVVAKVPMVLYICWTLGFTASLRINKELCLKFNSNQLKDYILLKSVLNTLIFLMLYFIIRFIY